MTKPKGKRGNPRGNVENLIAHQFKPKDPANPLTRQITFRVSDRCYEAWKSDREKFTQLFREFLGESIL